MPNPFGFLFGQRPASSPAAAGLMPLGQAVTAYGPAPIANLVGNHIARDVFPQPYVGPGQLDRDGSETAEMRANYDRVYREEPAVRSAVRGKVDSIIELDANVRPKNKANKYDVLAADLCQWAVEETDAGFDGLLDMMLTPACVHGHSFTEKVMKPAPWERQGELGVPYVWTFDQFHSLDVAWIKLQLDVYWNVTAIVNIRRGLEYYSPDCVLRYAHNGMYGNPFGQSDLRAVWRAAHIIEQAYKLWLIAAQVFGLPFIKAKAGSKERVKMLTTAMAGLRGAGYAIIDKDDDIEAINLASATGSDMFSGMIKTLREDAFLSIRGSYTPFLEGQGGENAHNDSEVSEDQANSTEKAMIKRASRVIRKQLFTWVVRANCPPGTGIPELHFGGTDRDKQLKFFQVVKAAQDVGVTLDADWVCTTGDVVAGEPGKQLQPPQPPQAPGGPAALPPGPGGPPPGDPPALPPKSLTGLPPGKPADTFADPGHNPPFPGAVYNPADHRYHKPRGADTPDDGRKPEPTPPADPNSVGHAEAADSRAKRILKRLAGVPAVAAMGAVATAKSTYRKYEKRYGPAYAKAIVAAGVIGLPVPAPGASVALMAAVRGIAELHRLLRKRAGQQFADAAPLDPEMVRRLGAAFVAELTDGTDTPAEQVARMAADLLDRAGFGAAAATFADAPPDPEPADNPLDVAAALLAVLKAGGYDAEADDLAGVMADGDAEELAAYLSDPDGEAFSFSVAFAEHAVGDKWQGKSGRWFTKNNSGRVVPTRDPNKQTPEKTERAGPTLKEHLQQKKAEAEPRRQAARAAFQRAKEKPHELAAADVPALMDHLSTLTRNELRDHARQALAAVSGLKQDLVRRLVEKVTGKSPDAVIGDNAALPQTPAPGKVYNVPTADLHVDPARFQFKLKTDNAAGVTDELKSVTHWNPDCAGVVSVWKDPADGKTYVVNGHHRRELAGRLGVDDLAVRYVDAKDATEARGIGALVNIAEGRGTAVDAAKFMRDTGSTIDDFKTRGVSLKEGGLADQAVTLTKLNDKAFDRVAKGDLDVNKALAVAKHVQDPERQEKLFKLLEKREDEGKDIGPRTLEEMARAMAAAPTVSKTESTLWGPETTTEDAFVQRAELAGAARAALATDLGNWAAVSSARRAGSVKDAGNVLNVDENKKRAEAAEQAKNLYDQLVNRKGPISDALNAGAEKLATAKKKGDRDRARTETIDAVRDAIRSEFDKLDRKTDGGAEGPDVRAGETPPDPERPGADGRERPGAEPAGLTPPTPDAAPLPADTPALAARLKGLIAAADADHNAVDDAHMKAIVDHLNALPKAQQKAVTEQALGYPVRSANDGLARLENKLVGVRRMLDRQNV